MNTEINDLPIAFGANDFGNDVTEMFLNLDTFSIAVTLVEIMSIGFLTLWRFLISAMQYLMALLNGMKIIFHCVLSRMVVQIPMALIQLLTSVGNDEPDSSLY